MGILSKIRNCAMIKKNPTPNATVIISKKSGTAGTCLANTCKSGSAMVMMIPRIKHTITGIRTFFTLLNSAPIPSPMGIIDISTPNVKNPIPIINNKAPKRNKVKIPGVKGAKVMLSSNTMVVMGNTDETDSTTFSRKSSLCPMLLLSAKKRLVCYR